MAAAGDTHIALNALDVKIENTFVTGQYLLSTLQKALNTNSTFTHLSTKVLAQDNGFLSVVIRIKLEWTEDEESLPKSIILKIPSAVKLMRAEEMSEAFEAKRQLSGETKKNLFNKLLFTTHNAECSFYQLQPPPEKFLRIPKLITAKKFATVQDTEAFIILEDMSETTAGRGPAEDLPLSALLQVADFLAELHAYSLTNSEWILDTDMKVTYGKLLGEQVDMSRDTMIKSLELIAKELPALNQYVARIGELYACLDDIEYVYSLYDDLEVPPVICMGDLWMNNILWKRDEHGKPTNDLAVVLDWQCSHPGIMTEDFGRLLLSSVSTDTRRNHLEEIVERYLKTLEEKLGAPPPFDKAKVLSAYRHSFKHCFLRIIATYPLFIKMYAGTDARAKKIILDRCQGIVEDVFATLDGAEFGAYSK